MGNSNSNLKRIATDGDKNDDEDFDDFEPIDKPASPTFMSGPYSGRAGGAAGGGTRSPPPNELIQSGILVDLPGANAYTAAANTAANSLAASSNPNAAANADAKGALMSKRRIVKATTAKGPAGAGSTDDDGKPVIPRASGGSIPGRASEDGDDDDDDEDNKRHHEYPVTVLGKSQQSDDEILHDSLMKDKEWRLQKLQTDQKVKRSKAVEEKRKHTSGIGSSSSSSSSGQAGSGSGSGSIDKSRPQPNPFSRFLSVFSVEPQFPNHKRRYEPSESELLDERSSNHVPKDVRTTTTRSSSGGGGGGGTIGEPSKRPKLDPTATGSSSRGEGGDDGRNHPGGRSLSADVYDWLDTHLPPGWPWMAAATTTAVVAWVLVAAVTTMTTGRRRMPPSPSSPPPPSYPGSIW